jgi:hypothetical protein
MDRDKKNNQGITFDKMRYECLQWKELTFWGIADPKIPGAYVEFQFYSVRKFVMYRMQALIPSEKNHPSGWNLDIIRFGEKKPVSRIANHNLLKNAMFEELFAVMGVLVDEEENPNLFEFISKRELDRLHRKWKRWSKDLPDWIWPTIAATNARQMQLIQKKLP